MAHGRLALILCSLLVLTACIRLDPNGTSLTPASAPEIKALEPDNGGPGARVLVKGANLGATRQVAFKVLFNDLESPKTERLADDRILAEVPAGAVSGPVRVLVQDSPTSNTIEFTVFKSLTIVAGGTLLAGKAIDLTATAEKVGPADVMTSPTVTWSVEDPKLARVEASGHLVSLGDRPATISVRAESGSVAARKAIAVLARPVSVALSPASAVLDAQALGGGSDSGFTTHLPLTATVRYSDGTSDSEVDFSTSDALRGFWKAGEVWSAPDASAGTFTLTARSRRDPSVLGVATFEVVADGAAEVQLQ